MKVEMKFLERLAIKYAQKYARGWDYFCVATDAYMAGYKQAKDDALRVTESADAIFQRLWHPDLVKLGEDIVEVSFEDGEHQLSVRSFEKWQKENEQRKTC